MDDVNVLDLAPYIKTTDINDIEDFEHIEDIYYKDIEIKKALHAIYEEEKTKSDIIFDQLFDKSYANFMQQVSEYVDEALDTFKNSLFPDSNSYLVQGASLILGMQSTDHPTVIDRLELYISKRKKTVKIYRVKPEITRKTQFTNLYQKIRESHKSLIIVERTESMGLILLESFIDSLHTILMEDQSKRITVLFCLSSNFKPLNRLLPISASTRMHSNKLIVAEVEDISRNLDHFLINIDCSRFSISCNLVLLITQNFIDRDPTLANLKYLYQYCMFQHFRKTYTVANLNKKDLSKLLKSHPSIVRLIKNLNSVKNFSSKLDWTSITTVANFCQDQLAYSQAYGIFLKDQICYYLYLLQDDLGQSFPSDLNDLYAETMTHDDLACSFRFVDAVKKLPSYPSTSILKRIDKALANGKKDLIKNKNNVYTIFTKFKGKLENNDDCKSIVLEFIISLIEHAQLLKNPLNFPLSEVLYSNDTSIRKKLMPMVRYDAFKRPNVPETYFEAIYTSILRNNEEISEADLYDEFKQFIEERHSKKGVSKRTQELNLLTPNKRARRSVHFEKINKTLDEETNLSEGLLKAIFIDTLENIEKQGLIRRTNKDSKKGILRRRVWP